MSNETRSVGVEGDTRDNNQRLIPGDCARRSFESSTELRPKRIQLRRTKGWRKPAGAVVVSRPTKWGNPWRPGDVDLDGMAPMAPARAVERYRMHLALGHFKRAELDELRGKDLACWCPINQPCHADVLLEVANR